MISILLYTWQKEGQKINLVYWYLKLRVTQIIYLMVVGGRRSSQKTCWKGVYIRTFAHSNISLACDHWGSVGSVFTQLPLVVRTAMMAVKVAWRKDVNVIVFSIASVTDESRMKFAQVKCKSGSQNANRNQTSIIWRGKLGLSFSLRQLKTRAFVVMYLSSYRIVTDYSCFWRIIWGKFSSSFWSFTQWHFRL